MNVAYNNNLFGCIVNSSFSINNGNVIKEEISDIRIFLIIKDKNNNVVYTYYYNTDTGNNIESVEFELNMHMYGVCEIKFSDRLNINILAEYVVEIYLNNVCLYRGFAANNIDMYTRVLTVLPFSHRLKEWHYTGTFTNSTLPQVLYVVMTSTSANTGIKYDPNLIDLSNKTEIFNFDFEAETIYDILNNIVKLNHNRYWYVDEYNYLRIKKIEKVEVKQYFTLVNRCFEKIKVEFDYKKLEATFYKVYRKTTDNKIMYIGMVGNPGNTMYPPIDFGTRQIEGIYIASEVVDNNDTALKLAYYTLLNQKIPQTVVIENVDLRKYIPKIGDYLYFEYYSKYNIQQKKFDIASIIDNIVKINYKLTRNGITCDFTCGDLLEEESDELFKLKDKVRVLENIAKY